MTIFNKKNVQSSKREFHEKDLTASEITEIYNLLKEQYDVIEDKIRLSVDKSDWAALSDLVKRRQSLQSALEEIDQLQMESSKENKDTFKSKVSQGFRKSSSFTEEKGIQLSKTVWNNLEKINQSSHHILAKAVDVTSDTVSWTNHINQRASRMVISKASKGLSKIADVFEQEPK
ncbi:hypothetical protein LGQ02_20965 [Bacillus shivajii]|uniref:hypothetical protein n=1 Tax=Bacillus shivajii TaxID=1983719 RepID=UPI001CF9B5C2|nr:hypothetical protein [Bacillus shivajii]UCZ53210.1 hypothetical protein LGQ02_20965 [Bacillus shivajii]